MSSSTEMLEKQKLFVCVIQSKMTTVKSAVLFITKQTFHILKQNKMPSLLRLGHYWECASMI